MDISASFYIAKTFPLAFLPTLKQIFFAAILNLSQGRFEIICLSGSYLVTDNGGSRGRSGGLSVLLASPDGRVIGGGVGGVLLAASPVQVPFSFGSHSLHYTFLTRVFSSLLHYFTFINPLNSCRFLLLLYKYVILTSILRQRFEFI